jgi:molecular chaperone DnaJ
MASRDFYVVLGVSPGATPEKIRSAYRELAKALHPDRTGGEGTAPFQELGEAYATLSDPDKRRAYDRKRPGAGPRRRVAPEVMVRDEPFSIPHGQARYRPSREALLQRVVRNFTSLGVPKGEMVRGLNLEVILTTEEATRGVEIPVEVPTFERCPSCGGSGHDWEYTCADCRGEGFVQHGRLVKLRVPPMASLGTVHELPLDHLGVHNFYLRVHVFVDDSLAS